MACTYDETASMSTIDPHNNIASAFCRFLCKIVAIILCYSLESLPVPNKLECSHVSFHCSTSTKMCVCLLNAHNIKVHIMCACCMCVGGILCPTIERSSPPPCFLSDVVKKAILDAFQISEGKQCRLWHRYMTNSYKQVKGEQGQRQWHNTNGMQRSVESVREGL